MAFYVPEIASPYLLKELTARLVIGGLADDISDTIPDLAWSGSEITFPVFTRCASAAVITSKGSVTPTEIDGSSTTAPIKHIAAALKWHQDTLRQSGRVLADLGIRDLADAMALKLDGDLVAEAISGATLKYASAAADALTADELEGGLALFGDRQNAAEFAGILIHSKLFPSFLKMNGFTSSDLTYVAQNNGIVNNQICGFYRGIPVFLTDNGTRPSVSSSYECRTILLKKHGLGYALKKAVEFNEGYDPVTFMTNVVADTYAAQKVLDTDKVVWIGKTTTEQSG